MNRLPETAFLSIRQLNYRLLAGILAAFLWSAPGGVQAGELQSSQFDVALHQLRYSAQERIASYSKGDGSFDDVTEELAGEFEANDVPGKKSPLKAAALSLIVPGLGQVYNGSHIGKAALFAGADVALFLGASKFNSDGKDMEATFQAYAYANWNEQDYWNYLFNIYGDTTDADDDIGASHGHHLPADTTDQQYFEMIGKYDQFSYGWARAEGETDPLPWDTASSNSSKDKFKSENKSYQSPKRLVYNEMRDDANNSFKKRDRMIIFAMLNHVVSAIDAAISANRHNQALEGAGSSLSFHPSVRHDENWALIPEIKLKLRF